MLSLICYLWFFWQVGLLGMKSVHVQHLAGNILVEVSESLVESVCCVTASLQIFRM